MTGFAWPTFLPQSLGLDGFQETLPNNLLDDSHEGGPPLPRRRTTANPSQVKGVMLMTTDEWEGLYDFFTFNLADGAFSFYFPPQGETGTDYWVTRFTAPPSRSASGNDLWMVDLPLEVLRRAALPEGLSVSLVRPSKLGNTAVFYAPMMVPEQFLMPSYNQDSDTIYTATVEQLVQYLMPSLVANSQSIYVPTVVRNGFAPDLYTDGDTFYAPRVSKTKVYPSLIANSQTFPIPRVSRTKVYPAKFTDAQTFYQPSVVRGLKPGLYTDTDTIYAPTVVFGGLGPATYTNTNVFYAPSLAGDQFLTASLFDDSTDTVYAPVVSGFSAHSLRVGDSGETLTRSQSTGDNRRKMTFSFFFWYASGSGNVDITKASNDYIQVASGTVLVSLGTFGFSGLAVSTSPTLSADAWNHVVVQIDTANATANSRVVMYINGTAATLSFPVAITSSYQTSWGSNGVTETVGKATSGTTGANAIDEMAKIDNQLLSYTSFASSNAPIDISGLTFGTDGYWLRFESSVASGAGTDSSGNSHTFTVNNFDDADMRVGHPANPT